MGGDGGSIPRRSEMVKASKAKKRAEDVTFGTSRLLRWTHCALSHEILQEPICIDNLGNLYNKISLIQSILNKTMPKQLSYIKKIKRDTIDCKITIRPNIQNININDEKNGGIFQCPISNLIGNGRYPFVCLRKCGCVISIRALKNVKGKNCLICGCELDKEINDYTRIPINPSIQKSDELYKMIMERKKNKKKNKNKNKKLHSISNDNHEEEEKKDDVDPDIDEDDDISSNHNNNNNGKQNEMRMKNKSKKLKLSKKEKKRKKKEIENALKNEKQKNSVSGHKRVLDAAEESINKKMKTSHVFASIFDRKQREFNFAGGGKGF